MLTLSYGFKQPQNNDTGAVVFPALEANWAQVATHNHDGVNSAPININQNLPTQSGNGGKYLTTNGAAVSWAAPSEVPSMTGNSNKLLTNNGVTASWSDTIAGDKTFSGNLTVSGDFTVNGVQTIVNSTDLQVVDKNIILNKDGNDASAEGAGITVTRTTDNGAFQFNSLLGSKWEIGTASDLREVVVSGGAQGIAGFKTFSSGISLNSQKIEDLLTPTALTDAANKSYADAFGGDLFLSTASTTVLTAADARKITQISSGEIQLPSTATLVVGVPYYIDNKGSSSVVVKSFGGVTTFATILRGHRFVVRPTSTVSENWSGVQIPFLFGGALNLGSNKVTNMTAGTAGTDGVNKTQLDAKLDSATLTTKGDILTRTASAITRLGVGSDGQVLTADSAQTAGIKWATPSGGGSLTSLNSDVSGLAVSSGIWSDLTSLSLTAGTWMISGLVQFATNLSGINDYVAITKYSGNDGTSVVYGQNAAYSVRNGGLNGNSIAIPSLLVVVPSTETWYLKATTDNGGTATGIGARLTAVKIA